MDQNLECEICGGTDFYKESGFYYCRECQTQSQHVQEQVFEVGDSVPVGKNQGKKIQKDGSKKEKDALTSWECYNIILKGLTDELINKCGAKIELKKVVKMLYMRYLHFSQVFEPRKDTSPSLNLFSSKHDIKVVYGIKKRKRKHSSSDDGSTYSRASSVRKRTMKKMALVKSQYEEFSQNSTQDTSLTETSLSELKTVSEKGKKPKKIKYNTATRKHLRKVMTNGHYNKHLTDFNKELTCHKLTYQKNKKLLKGKVKNVKNLTIATLYYILYLGLLIVRDKIQLGDLLRFLREGHVSYGAYFHLFPEDCQEKKKYVPRVTHTLSFTQFRQHTAEVAHFLKIEKYIEAPDCMELCQRYVKELNLPQEILGSTEKIISLSQPEMNFNEKSRFMPNYEGRALCFIIFTLKLFFGLDGKAEFKISECSSQFDDCFNFEKWLTYIKYRKCVIEKYHFPSSLDKDSSDIDSDMFLKYLKTQSLSYKHDNAHKQLEVRDYYQILEKIKNIPLTLGIAQNRQNFFEPSLTPYLSYIQRIPETFCQDLINEDFSQSSLNFVLEPAHFTKDDFDFGLNENLSFQEVFYCTKNKGRTVERENSKKMVVKISDQENYLKEHNIKNSKDFGLKIKQDWEKSNIFTFEKNRKKLEMPLSTKNLPFERFWLNIPSSVPNFYNNVINSTDSQKIMDNLPFSFRTLMQEGCRMLEQDFIGFYGEYILTEMMLVYREDLYLKNCNRVKSKDVKFRLALKGCLERW